MTGLATLIPFEHMLKRFEQQGERGKLPQEWVYAASIGGKPDGDAAYLNAVNAGACAHMLGFDVQVLPREVGGQTIPGSYVVRVTQPGG